MTKLRKRFGCSDEKNRWDCPLFRVNTSPAPLTTQFPASLENPTEELSSAAPSPPLEVEVQANPVDPPPIQVKSSWKPKSKNISSSNHSIITTNTASASKLSSFSTIVSQSGSLSFSGTFVDNNTTLVNRGDAIDVVIPRIIEYLQTAVAPMPTAA